MTSSNEAGTAGAAVLARGASVSSAATGASRANSVVSVAALCCPAGGAGVDAATGAVAGCGAGYKVHQKVAVAMTATAAAAVTNRENGVVPSSADGPWSVPAGASLRLRPHRHSSTRRGMRRSQDGQIQG